MGWLKRFCANLLLRRIWIIRGFTSKPLMPFIRSIRSWFHFCLWIFVVDSAGSFLCLATGGPLAVASIASGLDELVLFRFPSADTVLGASAIPFSCSRALKKFGKTTSTASDSGTRSSLSILTIHCCYFSANPTVRGNIIRVERV